MRPGEQDPWLSDPGSRPAWLFPLIFCYPPTSEVASSVGRPTLDSTLVEFDATFQKRTVFAQPYVGRRQCVSRASLQDDGHAPRRVL
jgi:hypothetical protein